MYDGEARGCGTATAVPSLLSAHRPLHGQTSCRSEFSEPRSFCTGLVQNDRPGVLPRIEGKETKNLTNITLVRRKHAESSPKTSKTSSTMDTMNFQSRQGEANRHSDLSSHVPPPSAHTYLAPRTYLNSSRVTHAIAQASMALDNKSQIHVFARLCRVPAATRRDWSTPG